MSASAAHPNLRRLKAFVINVETSVARRAFMEAQCAAAGLDVTFVRAVTPATLPQPTYRYSARRAEIYAGRPLMPTELACAASHMQLWQDLLRDADADRYFILEDDVRIDPDVQTLLARLDPQAPSRIVKFSGLHRRPMRPVGRLDDGHALYRMAYGPLDAGAYVIDKPAARKLLAYCAKLAMPVDVLMDRSYIHGVPIYAVIPYPAATLGVFDPNSPDYDPLDPLTTSIGVRPVK
jgi:glycosyl transferase family 25